MQNNSFRRMPFPVIWAGFVLVLYGAARAFFGVHMLFVLTVAARTGAPGSLIALNSFDLAIGAAALMTGVSMLGRRPFAAWIVKSAWAAFAFYEIGRGLGLAAGGFDLEGWQMTSNAALACALASIGFCSKTVSSFLIGRD